MSQSGLGSMHVLVSLPMGLLSRGGLRLMHYWLQNATLTPRSSGRLEVCRGHEPWKQHAHHRRMNSRHLRHVKVCHDRNEKVPSIAEANERSAQT
jgi:hypothetical protein